MPTSSYRKRPGSGPSFDDDDQYSFNEAVDDFAPRGERLMNDADPSDPPASVSAPVRPPAKTPTLPPPPPPAPEGDDNVGKQIDAERYGFKLRPEAQKQAAAGGPNVPVIPRPPEQAVPASSVPQESYASKQLRTMAPPRPPKSNLLQTIGKTLLTPRLGAEQASYMVHPKYAAERGAYEQKRGDLEKQVTDQELEQKLQTATELKKEQAEKTRLQGANYAEDQKTKRTKEQDQAKQAKFNADTARFKAYVAGRPVTFAEADDTPPANYTKVPFESPDAPGLTAYVPNGFRKATKDLIESGALPGYEEGADVPRDEYMEALKSHRDIVKAKAVADNKAPKDLINDEAMAIRAEGGDPNDPETLTPELSGRVLKRLTQKKLAERPVTNNQFSIPGLGGAQTPAQQQVSGEEYLKTLPPATAATLRQMAAGKLTAPSPNSRQQSAQQLRQALMQYDPSFSEQRARIRNAFLASKDGGNLGALNTAVVHMGRLGDAFGSLNNGQFTPKNEAWNWVKDKFGVAATTNFDLLKSAVAGEMATALKGNATDQEIAHMGESIRKANSPDQMYGVVQEGMGILNDKMNTFDERFHAQIPDDPWSPVLPTARAMLQRHGVLKSAPSAGGGAQGGGVVRWGRDAQGNPVRLSQ